MATEAACGHRRQIHVAPGSTLHGFKHGVSLDGDLCAKVNQWEAHDLGFVESPATVADDGVSHAPLMGRCMEGDTGNEAHATSLG